MVNIEHDFLTTQFYEHVRTYCYTADYYYGENDFPEQPPTGLVHNLKLDNTIVKYFPQKQKDLSLYRAYINYFTAGEKPNFHIDGEHGVTSIFYINERNYSLDEGGCTEILVNKDYLISVLPIANTLVTFDANLYHRATSFKTLPRFTIALKYQ
tara:strand:- start:317 stop:778 length:462 start_codon:yes stop_codon:yes gene_type:complete